MGRADRVIYTIENCTDARNKRNLKVGNDMSLNMKF